MSHESLINIFITSVTTRIFFLKKYINKIYKVIENIIFKILSFFFKQKYLNNLLLDLNNCDLVNIKVWAKKDISSLYIPPIRYKKIQKILFGLPYGRFYDKSSIEFKWYGHSSSILRYAEIESFELEDITAEHGNILSNRFSEDSIINYKNKRVLTFSKTRKLFLRDNFGIDAVAIGPYIHYAQNPFNSFVTKSIKKSLGRVITHFPFFSKGTRDPSSLKFAIEDHRLCVESLLNLRDKGIIDTIIICQYWADVLTNQSQLKVYKKNGMVDACCGTILNPRFLDQLKFIFELSDITSSNIVSTPLGYSLFFGKPHFTIGQTTSNLDYKSYDDMAKYLYNELHYDRGCYKLIEDNLFQIISKEYGFNEIKNKINLKNILLKK
jgi:hypothetical protein